MQIDIKLTPSIVSRLRFLYHRLFRKDVDLAVSIPSFPVSSTTNANFIHLKLPPNLIIDGLEHVRIIPDISILCDANFALNTPMGAVLQNCDINEHASLADAAQAYRVAGFEHLKECNPPLTKPEGVFLCPESLG